MKFYFVCKLFGLIFTKKCYKNKQLCNTITSLQHILIDNFNDWIQFDILLKLRLKAEVEHQLRTKDRNSDGRISLAEFREVEVDDQDVSHDIYNAELSEFRLYDRDLNMHLDREELEGMISGMTYAVDRIRDFMYALKKSKTSFETTIDSYFCSEIHKPTRWSAYFLCFVSDFI